MAHQQTDTYAVIPQEEEFRIIGRPATSLSSIGVSRRVNLIEADDDEFTPFRQDDTAFAREELSSNLPARAARALYGLPRDGTKPNDEQVVERNQCYSTTKQTKRRGTKQGRSSLERLGHSMPLVQSISPIATRDTSRGSTATRRSTRTKFRPLKFWENERLLYGAHNENGFLGGMPVVNGVQRASGVITYFDQNNGLTPLATPHRVEDPAVVYDSGSDNNYSSDEEVGSRSTEPSADDVEILDLTKRFNKATLSHASREKDLLQQIESLTDQLMCPVCYELKEDDMQLILECGHRICGGCCLRLENECHTCRATLKKRPGWLKRIY